MPLSRELCESLVLRCPRVALHTWESGDLAYINRDGKSVLVLLFADPFDHDDLCFSTPEHRKLEAFSRTELDIAGFWCPRLDQLLELANKTPSYDDLVLIHWGSFWDYGPLSDIHSMADQGALTLHSAPEEAVANWLLEKAADPKPAE